MAEQDKLFGTTSTEKLRWDHILRHRDKLEELVGLDPYNIAVELRDRYSHQSYDENWAPRFLLAHQVIIESLEINASGGEGIEMGMIASINRAQVDALRIAKLTRWWRQPVDGSDFKV